jgi:hypothetical protein
MLFAGARPEPDPESRMLRYAMRPYPAVWMAAGILALGYGLYCALF